jgi:hypothetical protein
MLNEQERKEQKRKGKEMEHGTREDYLEATEDITLGVRIRLALLASNELGDIVLREREQVATHL